MSELKPCPFCGTQAVWCDHDGGHDCHYAALSVNPRRGNVTSRDASPRVTSRTVSIVVSVQRLRQSLGVNAMGRYDSFSYREADDLCRKYNRATNPARYLTAHEHKRTHQLARAILHRLNRMRVPWTENEYDGSIRCGYYVIDGR